MPPLLCCVCRASDLGVLRVRSGAKASLEDGHGDLGVLGALSKRCTQARHGQLEDPSKHGLDEFQKGGDDAQQLFRAVVWQSDAAQQIVDGEEPQGGRLNLCSSRFRLTNSRHSTEIFARVAVLLDALKIVLGSG